MSRGSNRMIFRIPDDLEWQVKRFVARSLKSARGEPYTISSFIVSCIRERFAKLARAEASSKRKQLKKGGVYDTREGLPILASDASTGPRGTIPGERGREKTADSNGHNGEVRFADQDGLPP